MVSLVSTASVRGSRPQRLTKEPTPAFAAPGCPWIRRLNTVQLLLSTVIAGAGAVDATAEPHLGALNLIVGVLNAAVALTALGAAVGLLVLWRRAQLARIPRRVQSFLRAVTWE